MRKRVDHDATQEVSSSQLVPDAKPPAFTGPKNDASMWLQAPVSADDFVGMAKKKPARGGRAVVIGLTVVGLVGVTVAGVWYGILREPSAQTSALPSVGSAGSASAPAAEPTSEQPAVAASETDAGVAEVAATPPDAAAPDAGAVAVGALQVDAVSAADPAPKAPKKKTTKKRPAKKKATKKKTAKRR